MSFKIGKGGEIVGGTTASEAEIRYAILKALFGADANGVVTVPDAYLTGFTATNIVGALEHNGPIANGGTGTLA